MSSSHVTAYCCVAILLATLTDVLAASSDSSCLAEAAPCPATALLQSTSRTQSLAVHGQQRVNQEAVLVTVRNAESLCQQQRLLALARTLTTAGSPKRDLWLLHARDWAPNETMGLWSELRAAGLRTHVQPTFPNMSSWMSFGSRRSGWSKAAFLQFASEQKDYDYVWAVEDDVFFTGKWHAFFDAHVSTDADLLGKWHNTHVNASCRWSSCDLSTCRARGNACADEQSRLDRMYWPLLRLSRRFVTELSSSLSQVNGSAGHHEILTASFCNASSWCSRKRLSGDWLGVFYLAGWSTFKKDDVATLQMMRNMTNLSGSLPPNHLFHPVKCEADPDSGQAALDFAL